MGREPSVAIPKDTVRNATEGAGAARVADKEMAAEREGEW